MANHAIPTYVHLLVTVTWGDSRYLLMTPTADGWAIPAAHLETADTPIPAAIRTLHHHTALQVPPELCTELPRLYIQDRANPADPWPVTVPVHVELGDRSPAAGLPLIEGAGDGPRAEWIAAITYGLLVMVLHEVYDGVVSRPLGALIRQFLAGEL